jgi:ribose-phosphate pyrophosphokinase
VLSKIRRGDHEVEISVPDLSDWGSHTPVIIDDTISSAQTMIEAIRQIREKGLKAPICCAVHGVYDDAALTRLKAAGPSSIITSNTVSCETASVDISQLLADAIQSHRHINGS